nr:aldehyde dehydrogenase family protein [Rhodococcus sp. JVH1]
MNGAWQTAHSTDRIDLIDPATESWVASVVDGDAEDVAMAAAAARDALPGWAETSSTERANLIAALADAYDQRREEFASLVTAQNGAVISRSRRTNGTRPVALYRHYAEVARTFRAEAPGPNAQGIVRREPIGVVGIIIPWNAPQSLLAHKLGPALAAGCTVVVKPSPETSLDSLLIGEIATSVGFPAGVINVVTGGRTTGSALVEEHGIDMISFTGSTSAGRAIAARCGELLKPVVAELGGKSAAIVLDDADLSLFAEKLIATCLPNTGQVCYSCTRVIVPRSRFDEVLEVVTTTLGDAVLGSPQDPAASFGPLASATQRERVEEYIDSARAEGARVVLGGGRPAGLSTGYYVEPTVLIDVDRTMRVFREEIFGPVLVVVPHDGDEDAIRIANDSSYGLGGAVFSEDIERATDVARRMQTGGISINGQERSEAAPSSGYKDSGLGGDAGVDAHVQFKSIAWPPRTLIQGV